MTAVSETATAPRAFDPSPFLSTPLEPFHVTALGALFADDCMRLLPALRDSVVDTVFADPPFNLGKTYGNRTNDDVPDPEYLAWCKRWIGQTAIRPRLPICSASIAIRFATASRSSGSRRATSYPPTATRSAGKHLGGSAGETSRA